MPNSPGGGRGDLDANNLNEIIRRKPQVLHVHRTLIRPGSAEFAGAGDSNVRE